MSRSLSLPLAILGGGGKAGRPLVTHALQAGYRVRLLLRDPESVDFTHERLKVIPGDARDPTALRALIGGCQALLSTLGNPKGEGTPMLSTVTGHLLPALREAGIRRYVVVTSWYETGPEQADPHTRQAAAYMQEHFPLFMADRQREYRLLTESNLDWTYVRIPYLVADPATSEVNVSLEHLPGTLISAQALAHFLVEQLDSPQYIRQAPFVASQTAD